MKTYVIEDPIRLGILITRGGVPQIGKTVEVSVFDDTSLASPLVSSATMVESGSVTGFYYYDWAHSITEKTYLVVMYDVDSKRYTEDVLIDDIKEFIDYHDADGDGVAL